MACLRESVLHAGYKMALHLVTIFLLMTAPTAFIDFSTVLAQEAGADLDKLRSEITRLEELVREQRNQEAQTLEYLETIDRKISLTRDLIRELDTTSKALEKKARALKKQETSAGKKLEELRKVYQRRLVSLYKYGRIPVLELLLTARNLNEVAVWGEYQRRLSESDLRLMQKIRKNIDQLESARTELTATLKKQQAVLRESREKEKQLAGDKKSKQALLKKVRRNRQTYQRQLRNYREEIKKVQQLIARSEAEQQEQQTSREQEPASAVNRSKRFTAMRGELIWPVAGRIVRDYGTYQHPVLKTFTENLGIDIFAPVGTPVHAVAAGKVTAITWQRGRGNLLIINHGEGYYTVYTHLDEIAVNLQEEVEQGRVIGVVGDAGMVDPPVLHFQVWNKFDHLDPKEWLR